MTPFSLDRYEWQARLVPGLLALLPVAVTIAALGLRHAPIVSAILSLVSLAGGAVLLADVVRGLGLQTQERLWSSWGGAPTTIALRLREAAPNSVQRDNWRAAVQKVSGIQLSSARSESTNPDRADQSISAAVARIREMTRDQQRFYMVQMENRGYGYQRNFYAVRTIARISAFLGLLVTLGFILWPLIGGKHPDLQTAYILGLTADALIALGWFLLPSSRHVRRAGDKYAQQLLEAAVTLAADSPTEETATSSESS
jgi:hypothetical protein